MSDAIATPPAAAPAVEKQDQKQTQTPESQISEGLRHLLSDRLKGKKEKPPEEKKVEEPKPEKPKEEEPKPEKKPKAEEPASKPDDQKPASKVKVAKRAPTPDATELVKAATAAATKAALEAATVKKAEKADKPKAETEDLPEKYQNDIPILQRMEKMWPDKYKGLAEKFAKASRRVEAYRTKWEQENPGREFDPDDNEHSSFISSNEVDWEDGEYIDARAEIKAEQIVEKERTETKKKFDELEHRLTEKDLEPTIRKRQADVARELIKELDKDLLVLVDPDGRINKEELEKRQESDPEKVEAVMKAASKVAQFIDTAERILHPSGKFKFDEKNDRHVDVAKFLIDQEDLILADEGSQIAPDGKRFSTREEWRDMDERERRRRWRLELPDLIYLKRLEQREIAKQTIEKWESRLAKVLEARGYKKGEEIKKGAEAVVEKEEKPKPAAPKPDSPSATDGVKVDTGAPPAKNNGNSFQDLLKARLRGQKVS